MPHLFTRAQGLQRKSSRQSLPPIPVPIHRSPKNNISKPQKMAHVRSGHFLTRVHDLEVVGMLSDIVWGPDPADAPRRGWTFAARGEFRTPCTIASASALKAIPKSSLVMSNGLWKFSVRIDPCPPLPFPPVDTPWACRPDGGRSQYICFSSFFFFFFSVHF